MKGGFLSVPPWINKIVTIIDIRLLDSGGCMSDQANQKPENESKTYSPNHAWDYFLSAAKQRVYMFYVYLLVSGFFWGFFFHQDYEIHAESYLDELFLLIIFGLVSVIFHCLEHRSKQLVEHGEGIIRKYNNDADRALFAKDQPEKSGYLNSFGRCFTSFFVLNYIVIVIFLFYCAVKQGWGNAIIGFIQGLCL